MDKLFAKKKMAVDLKDMDPIERMRQRRADSGNKKEKKPKTDKSYNPSRYEKREYTVDQTQWLNQVSPTIPYGLRQFSAD